MQEVGRANSTCGKILSIQSQLGGLSFYSREDKRYDFRAIRGEDEICDTIVNEMSKECYDEINFYHNSLDYIIIPRELFDENMSDAYLLTKNIVPSQEQTITITLRDELAFISVIRRDAIVVGTPFVVFPLVAKCIANCKDFRDDVLSYIIEDDMLHIAFGAGKVLKFCETLPLTTESDFEFFIEKLRKNFHLKKELKMISLYENGIYSVSPSLCAAYGIKKMIKANYFEL